jgi:two-component system sensor histidine kinase YesM
MYRLTSIFLSFLLLLAAPSFAQSGITNKKGTPSELRKAANNLEKSLIENDNNKIARNYELLAQGFADKEEFAKAERYLIKALGFYSTSKDDSRKARVLRNIAKVQEAQHKLRAAAQNYRIAEEISVNKIYKKLNFNDFNRLKNYGNPGIEDSLLYANIILLKKARKRAEVADAYIQQAQLKLRNNDTLDAVEKYQQALPYAKATKGKANKIYMEIAELHVASKHFEEAVSVVKEMITRAKKSKDINNQLTQLQYLATVYMKMAEPENAVNALEESYRIASANGKTFEARESLLLLINHHKAAEDDKAMIMLYDDFIKNLDRIILSDNSLTDAKTFKVTEERIRRLESEKMFKDELIDRKNTFNYFLLGSIVLLLLLFGFIIKALYAIKVKNKQIALQSLRLEMNPHFIFNSLNSVNQFIAQNNELAANKFLTSYSNLMRNAMENSNKDFVTLGSEIENLTKYLELEHLRFKDKFNFEIKVDESIDKESLWIPNMIIQPHLENAIWHGLRYKEERGLLKMTFLLADKHIEITIDDDGIGPAKSKELKTHNQKIHNSRGQANTAERITLLNELYKTKISYSVTEKELPETGTVVKITFPVIKKPK